MKLFVARVETRSWEFTAYGETGESAAEALIRGWRKHARETGAAIDHVGAEDIQVHRIRVDECYRDGEPMGVD